MEHADFVISASQIANALGIFSTHSQVNAISQIIKKSVHRDLVLNPETNPGSETFVGSATYTKQRQYIESALNISTQWGQLQAMARKCMVQEDIQEIEKHSFQLLFWNSQLEQEVSKTTSYYETFAPFHKAQVLQLVQTLLQNPDSLWDNLTAFENYKTENHLDNLQRLYDMLSMSASLYRYVVGLATRRYGTNGEGKAISERNALFFDPKYHIRRTGKTYFKKTGLQTPIQKYDWAILGKIDGLANDQLFEIKHRKKYYLYPLPLYELIQVHAYMFLLGKSTCSILQCVRRRDRSNSENELVSFNTDFWNDVLRCLQALMTFIETLVSVPLAGEAFFHLSVKEKAKLLKRHVPCPQRGE
jgi:hypothetical protein